MAFDFGFNTGNPVQPSASLTGTAGFGSLNTFGMPSATGGGNLPSLGSGATPGGFGMNIPTLQLGLGGLSTLTNLYTGLKALGLAQDQFNFQRDMTNKNYANSVAAYNTSLTDKANSRAVVEGQSNTDRDAYIAANRLS